MTFDITVRLDMMLSHGLRRCCDGRDAEETTIALRLSTGGKGEGILFSKVRKSEHLHNLKVDDSTIKERFCTFSLLFFVYTDCRESAVANGRKIQYDAKNKSNATTKAGTHVEHLVNT